MQNQQQLSLQYSSELMAWQSTLPSRNNYNGMGGSPRSPHLLLSPFLSHGRAEKGSHQQIEGELKGGPREFSIANNFFK